VQKINWPTAVVLIVVVVVLGVAFTFGRAMGVPESVHDQLVAGLETPTNPGGIKK